jgi:hypothetical protein
LGLVKHHPVTATGGGPGSAPGINRLELGDLEPHTWNLESHLESGIWNLAHLEHLESHRGNSPEVWNHIWKDITYTLGPGNWNHTRNLESRTRNLEREDLEPRIGKRHPVPATGGGPRSALGINLASSSTSYWGRTTVGTWNYCIVFQYQLLGEDQGRHLELV